jgi:hypothetical protein
LAERLAWQRGVAVDDVAGRAGVTQSRRSLPAPPARAIEIMVRRASWLRRRRRPSFAQSARRLARIDQGLAQRRL